MRIHCIPPHRPKPANHLPHAPPLPLPPHIPEALPKVAQLAGPYETQGDDDDAQRHGRGPENPLRQLHVADVDGVHAEDAGDGGQRQEDDGDDGEGVDGGLLAVLVGVDLLQRRRRQVRQPVRHLLQVAQLVIHQRQRVVHQDAQHAVGVRGRELAGRRERRVRHHDRHVVAVDVVRVVADVRGRGLVGVGRRGARDGVVAVRVDLLGAVEVLVVGLAEGVGAAVGMGGFGACGGRGEQEHAPLLREGVGYHVDFLLQERDSVLVAAVEGVGCNVGFLGRELVN